jgi:hypothetical protein
MNPLMNVDKQMSKVGCVLARTIFPNGNMLTMTNPEAIREHHAPPESSRQLALFIPQRFDRVKSAGFSGGIVTKKYTDRAGEEDRDDYRFD